MDLFDLVRAAAPPQNDEETATGTPTEAAAVAAPVANPNEKDSSPLAVHMSPIFNPEDESDTEMIMLESSSPIFKLVVDEKPDTVSYDEDDDTVNSILPVHKEEKDVDEDDKRADEVNEEDVPLVSRELDRSPENIRECTVRIKRLTQTDIERLKVCVSRKKRAKPRKFVKAGTESSSAEESSLPPKRKKPSSSKVHIKVPWLQNGAKQRPFQIVARPRTPPPILNRSRIPTGSFSVSEALVQRYGRRFFNCVVKMKRLKDVDSSCWPKRKNRKSKSKLSVSFSEAVEILGSKPRKSSTIAGIPKRQSKTCSSVPTRLQRVDATGNVLEDIKLEPNMVLDSSSSSASTSKRSRSSCNGGRRASKLKRPSMPVPITDLASLRLDDSQDEETNNDADGEYIVPNEMPVFQTLGIRRSGTPTPTKRVTVTTTVSDEEGCEIIKAERAEEAPAAIAEASKSQAEDQATVENPTDTKSSKEKQPEQQQTDSELEIDLDPEPKQASPDPEQKQPESEKEQDEESVASAQNVLKAKSPIPIALAEDVTSDDILEIQTSIEDVRELHTPSSRQNTPELLQQAPNQVIESPESDNSFKSANEHETTTAAANVAVQRPALPTLAGLTDAPATLGTEDTPATVTNVFTGNEAASGTSTIPEPPYSPIGEIPNLDDDELVELVEPDFQLSGTRNAISRGTLDDIMTAFES